MSQDLEGGLRGADEAREIADGPDGTYCERRQRVVTDEGCLSCFTNPEHVRIRNRYRLRTQCCDAHMYGLQHQDRDALARQFIRDLECLRPEDCKAILANVFEAAASYQDEGTSKAFFRQVRVHAETARPAEALPI